MMMTKSISTVMEPVDSVRVRDDVTCTTEINLCEISRFLLNFAGELNHSFAVKLADKALGD